MRNMFVSQILLGWSFILNQMSDVVCCYIIIMNHKSQFVLSIYLADNFFAIYERIWWHTYKTLAGSVLITQRTLRDLLKDVNILNEKTSITFTTWRAMKFQMRSSSPILIVLLLIRIVLFPFMPYFAARCYWVTTVFSNLYWFKSCFQCKVCMQTFICTTSEVKCKEHAEAKHPKADLFTCFPHLKKWFKPY